MLHWKIDLWFELGLKSGGDGTVLVRLNENAGLSCFTERTPVECGSTLNTALSCRWIQSTRYNVYTCLAALFANQLTREFRHPTRVRHKLARLFFNVSCHNLTINFQHLKFYLFIYFVQFNLPLLTLNCFN